MMDLVANHPDSPTDISCLSSSFARRKLLSPRATNSFGGVQSKLRPNLSAYTDRDLAKPGAKQPRGRPRRVYSTDLAMEAGKLSPIPEFKGQGIRMSMGRIATWRKL